ncbi:MAG: glycoside hydrolase family 43 protein [Acidimicrobiales bacterium]
MVGRRRRWLAGLVGALVAVAAFQGPASAASTAPSYPGDFPDPFVLPVHGTYHAYGTQNGSLSVQHMESPDTMDWKDLGNALPVLPLWGEWGRTWAPGVLKRGLHYVLYYTVRQRSSGRQCISTAISLLPQGPFLDLSLRPLICQLDRGGSIDPYPFVDRNGSAYLLWKSDDNALGRPTSLWGRRLTPDGLSLSGSTVRLLDSDQPWEGGVVEGPAMVFAGGTYYLFYSANRWDSAESATGYATCATPLGPCTKVTTSAPWMASHGDAVGPGGPAFFSDDTGRTRIAYHAWSPGRIGYDNGGARSLWIDRISFTSGAPVLVP